MSATLPRKILCLNLGGALTAVEHCMRDEGWVTYSAADIATAQRLLRSHHFYVCVLGLERYGNDLLHDLDACIRSSGVSEWVGVFPAQAGESPALRDLILSYFFDYHTQPVDLRYLIRTVGHAYGRAALRASQDPRGGRDNQMGMVGQSEAMVNLRKQIGKVGATTAPVLISGESGSGKELAALAIHNLSPRVGGPFIAVNCGAISPTLIHSELFGHERGSFTGAAAEKRGLIEAASGGTIFLDEIADLPLDLQSNLLRFMQEKTINRVGATRSLNVDARVIAATHQDLGEAAVMGRFRKDLFYRLNVLSVHVPSLRERKEDVPLLAEHFYRRCAVEKSTRVQGFTRRAVTAMMSHDWPGNVRELFNRVQRAVVMTERRMITPADLELSDAENASNVGLDTARTVAEREVIRLTLNRVGGNITKAAGALGVSRMTLYRLMGKHGIALPG